MWIIFKKITKNSLKKTNNKSMLKTQQTFKGEKHNVFTEEANKLEC